MTVGIVLGHVSTSKARQSVFIWKPTHVNVRLWEIKVGQQSKSLFYWDSKWDTYENKQNVFVFHSFTRKEILVCLISHLCFVGGGWVYTSAHKVEVNCLLQYLSTLFLCQELSLKLVLTDWLDKLDSKPKDPSIAVSPTLVLIVGMLCPIQLFKRMWASESRSSYFFGKNFFSWVIFNTIVQVNHI